MRQRRVTGIEQRLAPYADLILRPADSALVRTGNLLPNGKYVRWYQRVSEPYAIPDGFERVYAELGCGRGHFINTLAENDPDGLYIGVEGCKTIVLRAIEKTRAAGLGNLYYIDSFINDAATAFRDESLDGVFLNFSDPWPKDRHSERRLTAPAKTSGYKKVLKPGGFVSLKTDNEAFFDYSLKTFEEAGFSIKHCIRNLIIDMAVAEYFNAADKDSHTTLGDSISVLGRNTQTEYELKFRAMGKPIYYFKAEI